MKNLKLPKQIKPLPQVVTYRHVYNVRGQIKTSKARCSIRRDIMRPHIYYDPNNVSAYAVDKSDIRSILSTTAAEKLALRYFSINSAYRSEQHAQKDVFVFQPSLWDGFCTHSGKGISRLRLNIHGYKSAVNTFFKRLYLYLTCSAFKPSEIDPCFTTKCTLSAWILMVVTTNDFLAPAPPKKPYLLCFKIFFIKVNGQRSWISHHISRIDHANSFKRFDPFLSTDPYI